MEKESANQTPSPDTFELESIYANNSRFEPSVWDLRILFGQLEQHTGTSVVDWHTAVTVPWSQAKILCYYLRLNLAFHEQNGPIPMSPRVTPPKPIPPTAEELKNDPHGMAFYELVKKIHAEMFGE